ncbi:hypothetical protein GH714_035577 [Hevea brasiliensis]|uniref:GATA transcription factor n=1 Tax=Hevea brasiliensis TaxID=3981 RepID=A0A6A6NB96_HEVBR|nr:hypothetical protein GH714_035577 [Hevea brasiliensis]
MEAPDFFIGGYFSSGAAAEFLPDKRISDQKPGDHFAVDDLLHFPNEDDAIMTDGFFDNITKNCTATIDSSVFNSNDSSNSSISGNQYDDLAELEWLSNFVEDSFSMEQNLQGNLHILSGSKPPTPESSSSESHAEPVARNLNNPMFEHETPLPGKARSKRSRAAPCDWSTRLVHLSHAPNRPPKNKRIIIRIPVRKLRSGIVFIVRRRRPLNGGLALWDQKLCVCLWSTIQVGSVGTRISTCSESNFCVDEAFKFSQESFGA